FGLHINPQVLEGAEGDPQLDSLRERFEETFRAVWLGAAEVDRFNALVLHAGLTWRQAAMLRAYAKYLRQVGTAYSQDYIEDAILAHRTTTVSLVRLFETRFDPKLSDEERSSAEADLVAEVTKLIDEVTSIDADRILRSYLNLIRATLRTNYFVTGPDGPRPYLALKLEPK
ncbi:NAD-glutamate dehydrogenase, partial [Klebsiella pneumoniae]|nr:NAD-glutamate dehydrogenase [Klebsiella pneumoniae]